MIRRLSLALVLYFGNVRKANRGYWGWIPLRLAWRVAGILTTQREQRDD